MHNEIIKESTWYFIIILVVKGWYNFYTSVMYITEDIYMYLASKNSYFLEEVFVPM